MHGQQGAIDTELVMELLFLRRDNILARRISVLIRRWTCFIILVVLLNYLIMKGSVRAKWDYFPQDSSPVYGIIMAGTSNKFSGYGATENMLSPCITKLYAQRHKYAFKIVKDLEHVDDRKYGGCNNPYPQWNKIKLMSTYINDVDVLVWIDLDAIITRMETPLSSVLSNVFAASSCLTAVNASVMGTDIKKNDPSNLPGAVSSPFFWTTIDVNPMYTVNVNTGVMALRRGDMATSFLERVWAVGNNPYYFHRHDVNFMSKMPCSAYYGWPWEQGGVWDVLGDKTDPRFLRATCILPSNGPRALASVVDVYMDGLVGPDRPFILHKPKVSIPELFNTILRAAGVDHTMVKEACD